MKLSKLWAMLFGAVALTACSKDELTQNISTTQPNPTASLSMEVEPSQEAMRATYAVESDGQAYRLKMPERDLNVYLSITRDGATAPAYTQVVFKKLPGVNRVRFSGAVNLPATGTGRYRVSAIVLSEVGGSQEFAKVSTTNPGQVEVVPTPYLLTEQSGPTLEANVPYVTGWVNLSDIEDGKFKALVFANFRPRGTLLRMRLENKTSGEVKAKFISVSTNAYTHAGYFDFTQNVQNQPAFVDTHKPGTAGTSYNYELPDEITLANTAQSQWYYIWVMPVAQTTYATEISALNADKSIQMQGVEHYRPLPAGHIGINIALNSLTAYSNVYDLENWGNNWGEEPAKRYAPLALFTERNLNAAGNDFATSDLNTASGYFTYQYAFNNLRELTIGGKKYVLPTQHDWVKAFPANHNNISFTESKTVNSAAEGGGDGYSYYASYYSDPSKKTAYGVRFLGSSSTRGFQVDQRYRTVYRYRLVGSLVENDPNVHIEATARYIGITSTSLPTATLLNDIKEDSYWTTNNSEDVVRRFPIAGYKTSVTASVEGVGTAMTYLCYGLSVAANISFPGLSETNGLGISGGANRVYTNLYPVRLLKVQSDVNN